MACQKNNRGFTLIELLVVIAIIGLLSTMAVVSLNSAREKARDAKRLNDLRQIERALQLYWDDNGYFPKESAGANGKVGEGGGLDSILTAYISEAPADPSGPGSSTYYYYYDGRHACGNAGYSYYVAVLFARTMEDPDKNANWSDVCNGPGGEGGPHSGTHMIVLGESGG